jgi:ABC-type bacteriocin/lantibiotic exporter with double-glycine peptidase domain
MGATGVGKTSFLQILAGINSYYTGEILYDNVNLSNVNEEFLSNYRTYITADYNMLQGSIWDNLRLAKSDLTEEELIDALKMVNMKEHMENIGFYNELHNGKKLSSGQRQRLSLARVFLKTPKILILDEPFSALDHRTTQEILLRILQRHKDATVIVTCHNKSILNYANLAIYLDYNGVIIDTPNNIKY